MNEPTNETSTPPPSDWESSELDHALRQLRITTQRLHSLSSLIVATTFINVALCISTISLHLIFGASTIFSIQIIIILPLFPLLASVAYLYSFDKLVSRGEVLYSEISDELEWTIREERISSRPNPDIRTESHSPIKRERPGLSVRVALREFIQASKLPFARGPSATAIYLTFNFVTVVFFSITTISLRKF